MAAASGHLCLLPLCPTLYCPESPLPPATPWPPRVRTLVVARRARREGPHLGSLRFLPSAKTLSSKEVRSRFLGTEADPLRGVWGGHFSPVTHGRKEEARNVFLDHSFSGRFQKARGSDAAEQDRQRGARCGRTPRLNPKTHGSALPGLGNWDPVQDGVGG